MRFLVVDDEPSFASLLGRALKRLGHQAVVKTDPAAALQLFREEEFDAVITDIDMPVMNGLELAVALRGIRSDLPIAFCRGIASDEEVLDAASAMGSLLPKVWTVADIKKIVEDMRGSRPRLAKGSQSSITPPPSARDDSLAETLDEPGRKRGASPLLDAVESDPLSLGDETKATAAAAVSAARRQPFKRKIKINCKSWEQVEKLCEEHGAGRNHLALRGGQKLKRGEQLVVALALPDELVLSVSAEVSSVRTDPIDGGRVYAILMVGLTPEVCARIQAMCDAGRDSKKGRPGSYARVKRRAPSPSPAAEPPKPKPKPKPSAKEEAKVLGSLRLRKRPGSGLKN
jgi:CheY-like chemotaxis protein